MKTSLCSNITQPNISSKEIGFLIIYYSNY